MSPSLKAESLSFEAPGKPHKHLRNAEKYLYDWVHIKLIGT